MPIFSSAINNLDINYPKKINQVKNWTFMLYFCADTRDHYVTRTINNSKNFLGAAMLNTINALYWYDLLDGSESNLNVIALFDHPYSPDYPHGQGKLYKLTYNNIETLANYGETNMGDEETLLDFIEYCKINYPATHYALTLSDHGRGYAGFCYDYHAPHPSYEYALGDCLTLLEVENALSFNGGVDVLFLDTCLGGSFEAMWQFEGEADYVVAGETIQQYRALYHPRDILYALSRNTGMSPYSLALKGFDSGVAPILVPNDPYGSERWPSIGLYNINLLDSPPFGGGESLMDLFYDFTLTIYDELLLNKTKGRVTFGAIRSNCTYPLSAFSSESMMVDLGDFVTKCIEHLDEFTFQDDINLYGTQLLSRLTPGFGKVILDEDVLPEYEDDNFTGFSLCFPYTKDMYQEYLYANLYEYFDIAEETYWDEFIFTLYPPDNSFFIPWKYLELYEIHIGPIDPTIHLDVYYKIDEVQKPLHVGYTGPNCDYGMGLDVDIEGAELIDDLITGACTIRIPTASLPAISKATSKTFDVVVNASTAASSTLDVNLTVKHIENNEIVWVDTKTSDIEVGQVIQTTVSTDDEWTDWEELSPPIDTRTNKFEIKNQFILIPIALLFQILLVVIFRKKK